MTDSLISNPERWANEVLSLLKENPHIKTAQAVDSEEHILVSFILLDREETRTAKELLEKYLAPTADIFACAVNGVVLRRDLPLEFSLMWRRSNFSFCGFFMLPFWPLGTPEVTVAFDNINIRVIMWYDVARQGLIVATELCLSPAPATRIEAHDETCKATDRE